MPPGCITKIVAAKRLWRLTDFGRSTHQAATGIAGTGDPSARSHESIDRRAERRTVAIKGQAFLFARTAPQATGSIAASETLLTNGRSPPAVGSSAPLDCLLCESRRKQRKMVKRCWRYFCRYSMCSIRGCVPCVCFKSASPSPYCPACSGCRRSRHSSPVRIIQLRRCRRLAPQQ